MFLTLLSTSAASLDDLVLDSFQEGSLSAGASASHSYRFQISSTTPDVKVVLLPLSGDTDAIVSFDPNATATASSLAWSMAGDGLEELLLRRDVFCHGGRHLDDGNINAASSTAAASTSASCFLYVRVRESYDEPATYKIGVLDARDSLSPSRQCAAGCTPALLANKLCDAACNVSACAFDRGACVPQLAAACSPGCEPSWLGDGYCDDACFTDTCRWDAGDCAATDLEGCADSCFAEYIDDGECDKVCNVHSCNWDGKDCVHGHDECYESADGSDYRGSVNFTASGKPCQVWSTQFPQQHFFTHARYPTSGLGGHNACRNPSGVNAYGVWCYSADPRSRWERCDVGPPSNTSCAGGGGSSERRSRQPIKARGPSICERACPRTFARVVTAGECDAVGDPTGVYDCPSCAVGGGVSGGAFSGGALSCPAFPNVTGDPCKSERGSCAAKRAMHERVLLVVWLSIAGTSLFVLLLMFHAYRLTSPMGSPRSFAAAGYTGLQKAQPLTATPAISDAREARERALRGAEDAILWQCDQ